MLPEKVFVHSRLAVKTVQGPVRNQLDEVMVAGVVLGQQHQMIAGVGKSRCLVGMIMADIDFAADDGLEAELSGGEIKFERAVKVAVVGDGNGVHAEVLGFGAKVFQADGAVQQAVFCMAVQVDKIGHLWNH